MRLRAAALASILVLTASACTKEELTFPKPQPGAKQGGTLIVGITEPQSIEPPAVTTFDVSGSTVVTTMCDTLITFDPVTGEPIPSIAESWQVSEGGRRVMIKMRKGVRFHNGQEVIAEDVVYTLSRIAQRDFASPVASIVQPIAGFSAVNGNEEPDGGDDRYRFQLIGVRPIDPFSFEIRLEGDLRIADFFRVLGHPATSPIPKDLVERDPDAFARKPICAGPYQLAEPWTPGIGEPIRLQRFAEYEPRNMAYTQGGAGYPDAVEFRIFPDRAAQVSAFQAGEIHVAQVPPDSVRELNQEADVVQASTPTLEYLGLPVSQEPFTNRGLRLALSQAIDRNALATRLNGGMRTPASGIFPPALGEIHREDACSTFAPDGGDVEAARETLAGSGVTLEGKSFKLYFNDEFGHRELMEAVAAQWQEAFGVTSEIIGMNWDEYLDRGLRQPGFDGPFRMSWAPEYPSPDRYIAPLFDASSIGQNNFSRFSDRNFDRVLQKEARRAGSEEDLALSYQQLEDMVCGEMPIIPLTFGGRAYLISSERVGPAARTPTGVAYGLPLIRELYLR